MNGKGMSMENVHVDLTQFTSVPATSKIGLINEKGDKMNPTKIVCPAF